MIFTGTYAILETAGQRLALVIPPTPHEVCGEMDQALPADRVGFLCSSVSGGNIRVETLKGTADTNLLRAAGFFYARQQGTEGTSLVLTEGNGLPAPRAVVTNPAHQTASAVLPLPERLQVRETGADAELDGILYHVTTENETFSDGVTVHLNPSDSSIDCPRAEAAAAAAIWLTRDMQDGTMELNIGVGEAVLEIGLRKIGGKVAGLSVGGEMRLLDVRVWELSV